ncbi:MAG: TRAP transporter substrate-binding protein DctP [Tissierellia bacterium]|jgi:TRAP-type C4-dicarboxylate transport system substrate-binding protein|nr:TRAP transporter substrate-binding protein DctP [Tissierellia bacterium]
MRNIKTSLILMLSLILIFTSACTSNDTDTPVVNKNDFEPVVLKFGNQHPVDSIATKADKEICAEIEEATEGRVKVELYTDSSLGDYTNIFEEVMVGSIDMAHITAVETYDARMSGSMLPYLGSNYEELKKAYDPNNYLYKTVFESAQELGIRTFGFFCEGFSGVGVNKPLENANIPNADKGVVVRVPGLDNFAVGITELGFRTSTIAYSDTYTSIQTGVVDGWAAGPANLNYLYFRDVITHYYDYMTNQEATQIIMNEKVFQSLLPEDQEAITEIIQRKCQESFELAAEDDEKYMKLMEDYGIEVIRFTDEERQAFAEVVRQNVWPKLAKNSSQEFIDNILESINN